MSGRQQLPLPFAAPARQTFANFLGSANDELIRLLARPQSGFAFVWLYGEEGVGKSHLLQAALDAQRGFGRHCRMVDLNTEALPDSEDGVEILAIDHLRAARLDTQAQRNLVAWYQAQSISGGWLIVAGDASPLAGHWPLADLASRLKSAQTFQVQPLKEAEVRALLTRRARERGLMLPRAVVDYWLTRRSRAVPALLDDLERLDQAAWVEQRRLTVPFMKGVLES